MKKTEYTLFHSLGLGAVAATGLLITGTAAADGTGGEQPLPSIVVTATRVPQSSFDLPMSIDSVDQQTIEQGQPDVNLSEMAQRIPGVVVQDRANYAQGVQVSSRGFGARASFGVRGVRLLLDGIPLTMPDGQGEPSVFSLSSAGRIEFLRGPFSSLYGNSSGGVIQAFTRDGPATPTFQGSLRAGSYGTIHGDVQAGGQMGGLNYLLDLEQFNTDGYRDHSATRWTHFNGKLTYQITGNQKVELLLNGIDQPKAEDPLGLTKAQYDADPRQAVSNAYLYDSRKTVSHRQGGLVYTNAITGADTLRVLGYVGTRQVTQYLPFGGGFGLSSGGVVDLDRGFNGIDARWTHAGHLAGQPLTWTAGVSYDYMKDHRKGFVNNNGTVGALRRKEDDQVYNVDEYLQGQWDFAKDWSLTAGVRHSDVEFQSTDYFITKTNPNDSGGVSFQSTNPAVGLLYHLTSSINVYANYGEGFETPTFAELAYRPDGATGLNFALQPSSSRNYEAGVKAFVGADSVAKLAFFHIDTDNEIVVDQANSGRTSYMNAGKTRRDGLELSIDGDLGHHFTTALAYSFIDARFVGGALDGNQLPAVPQSSLYGEVRWEYPQAAGFYTVFDGRWNDRIYVDEANSASAAGYATFDWRAGLSQHPGHLRFDEFVRVDNLADRKYVSAIIVGDSNGRYYEAGPGRNVLAGVTVAYSF